MPKTPSFPEHALRRWAISAAVLVVAQAALADPVVVEQVTDVAATNAHDMFQFSPDILRIEPGGEVEFRNSIRGHTVHSIPELWPEGAAPIGISYRPEAVVRFDAKGIYGITCRRHGLFGMVMLVVVGAPDGGGDLGTRIDATVLSQEARDKLRSIAEASGLLP
ncbi:plastocyanin/azurin family copper-binding protein [Tropicimonas aquimaris]|uniref:Plastocyanin/azurin family copper-binding protein n=1 Tax=Tropicimonas aquimaris TaxID=914152 RepID=A0ABW3ITW2_9RHOB